MTTLLLIVPFTVHERILAYAAERKIDVHSAGRQLLALAFKTIDERAAGGLARAKKLTPGRRRAIGRNAVAARWAKHKAKTDPPAE